MQSWEQKNKKKLQAMYICVIFSEAMSCFSNAINSINNRTVQYKEWDIWTCSQLRRGEKSVICSEKQCMITTAWKKMYMRSSKMMLMLLTVYNCEYVSSPLPLTIPPSTLALINLFIWKLYHDTCNAHTVTYFTWFTSIYHTLKVPWDLFHRLCMKQNIHLNALYTWFKDQSSPNLRTYYQIIDLTCANIYICLSLPLPDAYFICHKFQILFIKIIKPELIDLELWHDKNHCHQKWLFLRF